MIRTNNSTLRSGVSRLSPVVELRQSLASRVADISPFVDQLMRFLRPLIGEPDTKDGCDIDFEIALGEAIANAVIHGNQENPEKRVYVNCQCMEGEIAITVKDDGEGFDASSLPDPTDKAHVLLTHGRGIRLMQMLMNDVEFQENGTKVRMRKQLRRRAG